MENIEQKTQPENTKKEWISPEMTELTINSGPTIDGYEATLYRS